MSRSDKYERFFLAATNSPFVKRLKELLDQRRKASAELIAFSKSIGATEMYGSTPASYVFDFKSAKDVDMQTWSKTKPRRGAYYFKPRGNTTEGKAMAARIKALPECPPIKNALDAIPNLDWNFPVVIDGGMGYVPYIKYMSLKAKIFMVVLPWRDPDPKELAAYVKQRDSKKRHSYSASMDYALWVPPKWLKEIKEWEALKIIDESK